MSQVCDSHRFLPASRTRVHLLCASALALVLSAGQADARMIPSKPSVEVHLEVLRELQAASRGTSFAAPVQGRDSISATSLPPIGSTPVSEPVTASGRKVPSEQPDVGQYGELKRTPVNAPFGRASAPLPKTVAAAKPKPVAKPAAPKVVAKAAPKPTPKPVAPVVAKAPEAPAVVRAPEPAVAPAPDIAALDFSKLDAPTAPAPQEEAELMKKLEAEKSATPPALPDIALPAAPAIPELKPDLALPAPVTTSPAPIEPPKLPSTDVLVIDKNAAGELPPIPALPAPGEAPKSDAELMPSLSKRMDTLFAKQPEKQGIVEDKTTIEDPTVESKKRAAEVQQQLDDQQEAVRQAQLKSQEELKKQAETLPDAVLPKTVAVPSDKPTEIAALPAITPPSMPLAPMNVPDVDLPPPALPSLTAITGDGPEKSSLDIVQPQDGVASKDISGSAKAEMVPLDAPEDLPKVTAGTPPALPPITLPEAKKPEEKPLPPIPDFSGMKTEEKPEEVKEEPLAVKPLPAPTIAKEDFGVKPETPAETPAPIVEGSVSVSLTFDKDKTDLNESAKAKLNGLAEQIKKEDRNVRIVSYAAGTAEQASIARRISLSRALQIRAFLIDKGVNQLKINVQALGNKVTEGEPERADIYLK